MPSVLIVVADATIRKVLMEFFRHRGDRIGACASPSEAVNALARHDFYLLVTNLAASSDTLIQLQQALRQRPPARRPLMLTLPEVASPQALRAQLASAPIFSTTPGHDSQPKPGAESARRSEQTSEAGAVRVPPTLEAELRQAIDEERQILHYQPIVSLTTGRIAAFEALVRWRHEERGLLGPDELIPACEETGLILPLGRWILRQACSQTVVWREQRSDAPVTVNVNTSGKQLTAPDFVDNLSRITRETGARPADVALEVKESLLVDTPRSMVTLWQLRKRGFRVQIDAFGTGYTSLRELYRSPIEALKIDRSFVARMKPGGEDTEIVGAAAGIGSSLGMAMVAEGVETAEHLARVRRLGFGLAQGYFFAPPLPAEEATKLLLADRRW